MDSQDLQTSFEAKKAKKMLEQQAKLLHNRVNLLKKEESKAWRRIEETQKRASEVVKAKKNHEDRLRLKEEVKLKRREVEEQLRERNFSIREHMRNKQSLVRNAVYYQRQTQVGQLRAQSLQQKQKAKEDQEQWVRSRATQVRQMHSQTHRIKRRVDFFKEMKNKSSQMFVSKRVELLEQRTEEKAKELALLEAKELELIKRLQTAQDFHKQAFAELDLVLD
jgi:hypothetical protein